MIQKPRGTMDILPKESKKWQFIEKVARDVCRKHGFGEIRFPTFEETQLFKRGVGDTTDVVQKEMYTFTDRDGTSYTLRPEGTACVARSVIENGLSGDTMPLKLFYIINCFRHERPQAGRYREFYQFGAELFGATTPSADTELICLADDFLKGIGINNTTLHVNSIGCPECRPQYKSALVEYFSGRQDELCDTCKSRLHSNPLRILDCKSPICSAIAKDAPKTIDHLCDACKEHFEGLKARLNVSGIDYEIDCNIVRGLDYYSRTVFEFISEGIGSQSTVCGGGRYDGLVEQIGGPKLAGIGFAAGINRLILTMENGSSYVEDDGGADIYIAPLGEAASVKANEICAFLRKKDIVCDTDLVGRSLKAQMKYANKINAKNTLIIGDGELENGKAQLRNMLNGEQTEVSLSDLEAIYDIIK
ncbi:MAG: histidine--tRNA ligase [Clostridia bacterium]|nr:histidine--tRNA ligase [Clostridia bacterium]